MTGVETTRTNPAELTVDAIVVGLYQDRDTGSPRLAGGAEPVDTAFSGRLAETLGLLGATGAVGETTKLASLGAVPAPVVVGVGLGDADAATAETLRRAAGAATRALAGCRSVGLALPLGPDGFDLAAVAEGALLGAYRFAGYRTKPAPTRREPVDRVSIVVPDGTDREQSLARVTATCDAVYRTRDWVNTAPNELRPPQFAQTVADAATQAGLEVEVLDEDALREGGYGGVLAVGLGSAAPPRLVRIAYRGENARSHVALVGKGVTFDTGGVAIKPAQGMWEMKSDMAGAAAVAATMLAVAAVRPNLSVTAYIPMAENMVSGTAYRPGDVVTMYNGKRIEVLNTDAEGRMILADAIARACEDEPDYLLETSTLTGGQIVALGKRVAGVMGTEELCERIKRAGDRAGELCWPMPMPDDVRKNMESEIADFTQVANGMDRGGHMLQGAIFLSEFVADGVPWAHIDVAGPAYHTGEPYGYVAKGGTGVPVRTLLEALEDIAANG